MQGSASVRTVLLPGVLGVVGMMGLTGCGVTAADLAGPGKVTGAAIKGNVHGGQQPVVGAQVYVLGANVTGYGETSFNLIGSSVTTSGVDGFPYVTTDAAGSFSITGDYACSPGQPVYLLALGGDPGVGVNNPALALMAALGSCPAAETFSSSSFVEINEVTTVAAVYALSGFLTGPENLSIPEKLLAATGIVNAVNNAGQLVDVSTGTALTTTPNGAGAVPAATINTLANIVASCVNSDGSLTQTVGGVETNTSCGNLFAYTTADSVAPTETVTALLNLAHNPAVHVMELYQLAEKTSPFVGLTTQPNDFTLSLGYSASSLVSNEAGTTANAGVPAVDAAGNVWFPVTALVAGSVFAGTVQGLSPLGAKIGSQFIGFSEGGLQFLPEPMQAAVDNVGNVWTAVNNSGTVYEYFPGTDTGTAFNYNGVTNDDGHALAIDTSGNVYVSDYTHGGIFKLGNTGAPQDSHLEDTYTGIALTDLGFLVTGETGAALEVTTGGGPVQGYPGLIGAILVSGKMSSFAGDRDDNVWMTDLDSNSLLSYSEKTVNVTSSPQIYSGGGLQSNTSAWPIIWVATDGGSNVWVSNYGSGTIAGNISEFDHNGNAISPATGFLAQTACAAQGLAIDGSGDVWVGCGSSAMPVLEYIGAAVPVHTPLTPGMMGVRP